MTVCRLNNICLMDLILLIKYYMLNICSIFTSRNRFLMQIESMIEKKGLLNTFSQGLILTISTNGFTHAMDVLHEFHHQITK